MVSSLISSVAESHVPFFMRKKRNTSWSQLWSEFLFVYNIFLMLCIIILSFCVFAVSGDGIKPSWEFCAPEIETYL